MSLTDMVIMPGNDYQNTCDAIREKTGGTELLTSGQLPSAVAAVFQAGVDANEVVWAEKFYTAVVEGNGENSISVPVPFEPDYVVLGLYEPYSTNNAYKYAGFLRDFRTFARIGGFIQKSASSVATQTTAVNNNTVPNYIAYGDGAISFIHPSSFDAQTVWDTNSRYRAIAMKYTDYGKTDEDLLKDYVMSLPDSGGEVTISQRRFTETGMTEEEFEAYTAANKPNWTFVIA